MTDDYDPGLWPGYKAKMVASEPVRLSPPERDAYGDMSAPYHPRNIRKTMAAEKAELEAQVEYYDFDPETWVETYEEVKAEKTFDLGTGDSSVSIPHKDINAFVSWIRAHPQVQAGKLEGEVSQTTYNVITLHVTTISQRTFKCFSRNGAAMLPTSKTGQLYMKKFLKHQQQGQADDQSQDPNSTQGNSMEKNAAAILRTDTKTIGVKIVGTVDSKEYTYVTHLNLKVGDYVVVPARDSFTLAQVSRVDADLEIQPKDNVLYKWVVQKVDMDSYLENAKRNKDIEDTVRDSYRAASRAAFAGAMLQNLPADKQEDLKKLLGN